MRSRVATAIPIVGRRALTSPPPGHRARVRLRAARLRAARRRSSLRVDHRVLPLHTTRWRCRCGGGRHRKGGIGPNSSTDGVPKAVARWATRVSPQTTRSAPATARARPRSSVAPASMQTSGSRAPCASARAAGSSSGLPVTTTRWPRSRSALATSAKRSGGQRRAELAAPRVDQGRAGDDRRRPAARRRQVQAVMVGPQGRVLRAGGIAAPRARRAANGGILGSHARRGARTRSSRATQRQAGSGDFAGRDRVGSPSAWTRDWSSCERLPITAMQALAG